jgi:hypothetical protein
MSSLTGEALCQAGSSLANFARSFFTPTLLKRTVIL